MTALSLCLPFRILDLKIFHWILLHLITYHLFFVIIDMNFFYLLSSITVLPLMNRFKQDKNLIVNIFFMLLPEQKSSADRCICLIYSCKFSWFLPLLFILSNNIISGQLFIFISVFDLSEERLNLTFTFGWDFWFRNLAGVFHFQ